MRTVGPQEIPTYLGTTQPHDRVASQAGGLLTSHLSTSEISALAQSWLAERMNPTSGTNTFSAGWGDTLQSEDATNTRTCGLLFLFR